MIQTVLMFLAPAQEMPLSPRTESAARGRMATRLQVVSSRSWSHQFKGGCAIAADALGLILFLAGLGLVLRVAEVMLYS